MKRRLVKISLAILIVAGVLLGLLIVLTRDWGPEMSFGFLDGRALTASIKQYRGKSFYSTTREVYSFEADFNDVCAKADAELSVMGFKNVSDGRRSLRNYRLGDHMSANKWIVVRILDMCWHEIYSSPEPSKFDGGEYYRRTGWVSVEVRRSRLRSWPPQYLLTRLKLMRYRRANQPPAQDKNAGTGNKQGN
ncbi:MAG: hypothetical protein JSW59_13170 [Phycisphaerales bacterium]|nr:MAG: hypothetical protein JSW59_13170 [Phycisphaerales bacterium]